MAASVTALHLVKLCVGVLSPEDLRRLRRRRADSFHETRMFPARADEILNGGSLYWVFGGLIRARQAILAFEPRRGGDGVRRCRIVFKKRLILTEPQPRRPFRGWRYLNAADAPPDVCLAGGRRDIRSELEAMGLF